MKEVHANCNPKVPKNLLKVGSCVSHCLVLGTGNALFSCFDHLSYFDHNLLISDPI